MRLEEKQCVPCSGKVPPLEDEAIAPLLEELGGDWRIDKNGHLTKDFAFEDFAAAMKFAERVGVIAELEGHHPDLHVGWGRCQVEIWTHAIDGLTESDFILAAKVPRALHAG
jgi:4a-hydroxytetrahydrobiopterin dehydratase